jgi:hypothetical protein
MWSERVEPNAVCLSLLGLLAASSPGGFTALFPLAAFS